jgi:hypothetical protein
VFKATANPSAKAKANSTTRRASVSVAVAALAITIFAPTSAAAPKAANLELEKATIQPMKVEATVRFDHAMTASR